ncbi:hypothetical protein FO519_007422 [Halicephalobus sp. NKZ332]|nr:hypothetical protein FO519_007422 [Halicephalobus sp. NKZ332]
MASQASTSPPLEVVCRIRPIEKEDPCVVASSERYVKIVPPLGAISRSGEPLTEKEFKFAHVFDGRESQNAVFRRCAYDLLEGLFSGTSGLLFAYGVTNSGKTYTMAGESYGDKPGILPRSLDILFKGVGHGLVDRYVFKPDGKNGFYIQSPSEALRELFVSFVEIYNDVAYDLFDDVEERRAKNIRRDGDSTYVEGVKEIEVQSVDEVLELYFRYSERNRHVGQTALNEASSRSHSIFTVRLVTAPCGKNAYPVMNGVINVAELVIVDLAGSERAKRTENTGDRMVEMPYRDCKLTYLFRTFFEGRGKIRMIVCVNPRPADYEENVFVMNFAEVARQTKINVNRGPIHKLEDMSNLPFPLRDISQWSRELQQGVGKLEPLKMHLFEKSPIIELGGPDDIQSISRMRDYFTGVSNLRAEYNKTVKSNAQDFLQLLRERLMYADLCANQLKNHQLDLDELRKANDKLIVDRTQLRRENDVLKINVSKYEVDILNERRREEEENARVRQASVVYEKQRHALKQVENIFETPVSVASYNVATIRKQFDENSGSSSAGKATRIKTRTGSRPPVGPRPRNTANTPGSFAKIENNPSYLNPRYNGRRSQSNPPGGRILDHQATNQVPMGTVFQPNLPRNTRHTTRPSTDDLKKCTEYVLNKQGLDSKGNLRTDLYKGKVIPTAGGGSAVLFNDVEILAHDSPNT